MAWGCSSFRPTQQPTTHSSSPEVYGQSLGAWTIRSPWPQETTTFFYDLENIWGVDQDKGWMPGPKLFGWLQIKPIWFWNVCMIYMITHYM